MISYFTYLLPYNDWIKTFSKSRWTGLQLYFLLWLRFIFVLFLKFHLAMSNRNVIKCELSKFKHGIHYYLDRTFLKIKQDLLIARWNFRKSTKIKPGIPSISRFSFNRKIQSSEYSHFLVQSLHFNVQKF